MVDETPKETLCIYEGYLIRAISVYARDKKSGVELIIDSLNKIHQHRGSDKVKELAIKHNISQYGITLK